MLKRTFQFAARRRRSTSGAALTISSVALIAATYGMARFGVGLLHPQMAVVRPGLEEGLRPAGTAQFVSYCIAVLVGGQLAQTRARSVTAAAGLCAGAGCLGLVVAETPPFFTIAAFIAGSGAGLASPALVPLLDRAVPADRSSLAQTAVNSGTAIGLISCGALVLLTTGISTPWLITAIICVASGAAVCFFAPDHRTTKTADSNATVATTRTAPLRLVLPILLAAAAGAVSAYVWTYGPSVIIQAELVNTHHIGWLWVAVGGGGLFGVFTSPLVDVAGPTGAFLISSAGIGLATTGVVMATQTWVAIAALALFGASYMILSGVLILWSRVLQPDNRGQATAWLFLALAVGQVIGTGTISA